MTYSLWTMPSGHLATHDPNTFIGIAPTIDDAASVARVYSAGHGACNVAIVDRSTGEMIDWGSCSNL